MPFVNKTVSNNGTEYQFLANFVSEFCAADSRITSDKTPDEIINDKLTAVNFDIDGKATLALTRGATGTSAASNYKFALIVNDNTVYNRGIPYCNNLAAEVHGTRTWKFLVASNNNTIVILLGGNKSTIPNSIHATVTVVTDDTAQIPAVGGRDTQDTTASPREIDPFSVALQRVDEGHIGENIYLNTNRLPYAITDGQIEIIKNKIITDSDGYKGITASICDCSTIAPYNVITVDGQRYYAANSNSLVVI